MDTTGQVIRCKAAVAWEINKPMVIEEVEIDPPKSHEVRIKVIACAICRSDLSGINGYRASFIFPAIFGHEAAGIVESIGPDVTSVKKGDHVLPSFIPQCNDCRACRNPEANACESFGNKTSMRDGTSRIRCKGKTINHGNCSTFAEYAVLSEQHISKISAAAPLEKVCLIGCGFGTGYGAARMTAKVKPGSICAVWGLGAIGLSAIMGCRINGAIRIIAIDVNPRKAEIAKKMGATEFFNPKDHSRPVHEVLVEMTDGGVDYAFECVGNSGAIKQAFHSCHPGTGSCILVGLPPTEDILEVKTLPLLRGLKLTGCFYGGYKPRNDIPRLVEEYLDKKFSLDELISEEMPLENINEGVKSLNEGKVIRVVLNIGRL